MKFAVDENWVKQYFLFDIFQQKRKVEKKLKSFFSFTVFSVLSF
jgi:hypothetical protein